MTDKAVGKEGTKQGTKMTNDDWRMTIAEGDAGMAAVAANHRSRHNKYKEVRNSWLWRLAKVLVSILKRFNSVVIATRLRNPGGANHYGLWSEPRAPQEQFQKHAKSGGQKL
jgi:hypothetical protein